jgi:serine/threonine protein kinase
MIYNYLKKDVPMKKIDNQTILLIDDQIGTTQEITSEKKEKEKINFNNFEIIDIIGIGGFGTVYKVKNVLDEKIYAMKVMNKNLIIQQKYFHYIISEYEILKTLSGCPFILDLYYCFQSANYLYMIIDYCSKGDMTKLKKIINIKLLCAELILSIEYIHKKKIIYRDLKPENILLDEKGHVKLTDFGLSKILDEENDKAFTICGTPQYLAPEVLLKKGYDKTVDWWSLGCVMYEMLSGRLPFAIKRGMKLSTRIYERGVEFPPNLTNEAIDLIKKLLIVDPQKRLGQGPDGSKNIKNHPFFNNINWEDAKKKKLKPPFIPKLKNDTDLRYFDTMFTDEPISNIGGPQRKNTNRDRDREPSNDYNGFTYMAGSVSKELSTLATNNEMD